MTPTAELVARVESVLTTFLDDRARVLREVGPELAAVSEAARHFVLDGGKRLRPIFTYWGWRAGRDDRNNDEPANDDPHRDDDTGATSATASEAVVLAAASLELLHGCALVHDDVMDASRTRRGHPATHAAFAARHRQAGWSGDADVFGVASAILVGDLLLSWADQLFAAAPIGAGERVRARSVYDQTRQLVMAGQYLDALVQARGEFSVEDAVRVARYKTSTYTIEGPLHLGAAIAGAPPETFRALSAYGLPLGEAFQLRDDLLGTFGDPRQTGKPAGDDLREGKQTVLVAAAVERATDAQAAMLRAGLGDRSLSDEQVGRLRAILLETGAVGYVEARIAERADEARAALAGAPAAVSASAGQALAALVDSVTRRAH